MTPANIARARLVARQLVEGLRELAALLEDESTREEKPRPIITAAAREAARRGLRRMGHLGGTPEELVAAQRLARKARRAR